MTSDRVTLARRGGLLALAAALVAGVGAAKAASARVGAPAPPLLLRTLDGAAVDLGRPTGQVEVVNFWATWCGPCRAEMPMLDAFFKRHRAEGVRVLGVSADRTRDKARVREVMKEFAYPAGLLAEARTELDPPRALPMTYIVDRQGVVRAVFGGLATTLDADRLESAVRPLL